MTSKTEARLLITCVGGKLKSLEPLFFKKNSKFLNYVVGVDTNKTTVGKQFVDKFYLVPSGDDPFYIEKLLEIVRKDKINLIIPCSDEEARALSRNKRPFLDFKCHIASVDFETINILSDKIKTYEILKLNRIEVPKYFKIENKIDLKRKINEFVLNKESFVIKPSLSRGGRNVVLVNPDNLEKKFKKPGREKEVGISSFLRNEVDQFEKLYPLVIMEKLNKPVLDLDLLCWNGCLKRFVLRKRINDTNPNEGHEIIVDKKIEKLAKSLSHIFNLSWLYDCDLMLDKNNNYKILEINPRPSGSAIVSMIAGYNFYDDIYDLMYGNDLQKRPQLKNQIIEPKKIKGMLE